MHKHEQHNNIYGPFAFDYFAFEDSEGLATTRQQKHEVRTGQFEGVVVQTLPNVSLIFRG